MLAALEEGRELKSVREFSSGADSLREESGISGIRHLYIVSSSSVSLTVQIQGGALA